MKRKLDVVVDSKSWAPKPVPPEINARVGRRNIDVLVALIYTALVTRPPTIRGFHLSDYWAWLRYFPALAKCERLCLCQEWWDVDTHQKTVLSDELGVGFTTQFITEALDCSEFTDTLYVVNVLDPTKLKLMGGAKRGPQKSPDYIARDRSSNYIVLECKGTQSSRSALRDAIKRGQEQKRNISATNTAGIAHSLVAGLFIPQWQSKEYPCIRISDPGREELEGLLSEQPKARINDAITQIGLAKQFAMTGLGALPAYLGLSRTGALTELPDAARAEIKDRLGTVQGDYQVVFDSAVFPGRTPEGQTPTRARFSVKTPPFVLERLISSHSISEVITEIGETERESPWKIHSSDLDAEVITPIGFGFRLQVEPH